MTIYPCAMEDCPASFEGNPDVARLHGRAIGWTPEQPSYYPDHFGPRHRQGAPKPEPYDEPLWTL